MKSQIKLVTSIVGLVIAFSWLMFMSNKSNVDNMIKREVIEIDSIQKKIIIPEKTGKILFNKPELLITKEYIKVVNPTNKKLINLVKKLELELGRKADSLDILNKLYSQSIVREYEDKHEDSLVIIRSRSTVEGRLLKAEMSYIIKEQEAKYYNRTRTITRYIDDGFTLYGGGVYADNKLYGTVALRTNSRKLFTVGYSTGNNWMFGASFPLTSRKKPKTYLLPLKNNPPKKSQ